MHYDQRTHAWYPLSCEIYWDLLYDAVYGQYLQMVYVCMNSLSILQ